MHSDLHPDGCTAPDLGCLLEDYLNGDLPEDQGVVFEEHYFGCGPCLEAIRIRQSGPHALAQWRQRLAARTRFRFGIVMAVVVIGVTLYAAWSGLIPGLSSQSASTSLADLGRVSAPQYVPSRAEGHEDAPRQQFLEAMKSYVAGEIVEATLGLEASWRGDPSRAETGYYLGACYLVSNRVDRAVETLGATIALGDSPFLDRSRLLLAKAYLRHDAISDARRELREVMVRGGSVGNEAEHLLEGIDRLTDKDL